MSPRIVRLAERKKKINLEVSLVKNFEPYDYLILKLMNPNSLETNYRSVKNNRKREEKLISSSVGTVEELRQSFMMNLEEKEINLEKFNRENLVACITKIFVLMMVVCVLEMIAIIWLVDINIVNEAEYRRVFSKKHGEFQNLYGAYTSANLYHQIATQSEFLQRSGLEISELKKKLANMTFNSIRDFQIDYLTVTLTVEPIEYDLEFRKFDVKTDTSKTNLVDYSQNLGTFKLIRSMKFLAQNYHTLTSLGNKTQFQTIDEYNGF